MDCSKILLKASIMYTFEQILPLVEPSYGELCCRKRVGYYYSFAIDFGEKIYHNQKRNIDPFYGEWQFRTYNCKWKIIKDEKIILEGQNNLGTNEDVDNELQQIEFGRLVGISANKDLSLTLTLDNMISIEFFPYLTLGDEEFHIFLPDNRCLVYHFSKGWQYGRGDLPWPNHLELDCKL